MSPFRRTPHRAGATPRPRHPRRRGVTCVLAMLYLVIFAALALGFYAQTNIGAQVSNNERNTYNALIAAESGMAFIRYHLNCIKAKYMVAEDQMLVEVASQLATALNGSANLGASEVGMSTDGTAILIPADPTRNIKLTDGKSFRIKITRSGRRLVVQSIGTARDLTSTAAGRGVEYTFEPREWKASIFDFGIAGRGQVEVAGNAVIRGGSSNAFGSVLSTSTNNPAVTMTGGGSAITGDVYVTNPSGTVSYSAGSSVAGNTDPAWKTAHTHIPWAAPEFPVIDTNVYLPFVKRNCTSSAGSLFKNIRIPANTGTVASPFTFGSGTTIEGVCYVEAPNVINFAGTCTIRGVIVGANTAAGGDLSTNVIEFKGQAQAFDMLSLATAYDMSVAANVAEFPSDLLKLGGASVILPGFNVKFSGGYASISGAIVSDQLTFSGTAGGNITGSVMGLGNQKLSLSGGASVQVEKPGSNKWPAGLFFRNYYSPKPDTYREFLPGKT